VGSDTGWFRMSRRLKVGHLGIRQRTTLIAVLVVGVSLGVAMVALVVTARTSLETQITNTVETRAQDIALLVSAGPVPHPIPGRGEDLLVQVIDDNGEVVASSASIDGQAPLNDIMLAPGQSRTLQVGALTEFEEEVVPGNAEGDSPYGGFVVAAVGAESPGRGPQTVLVAASLDPVMQLESLLAPRLALGLPVILLVVGLTVWALTGQALRPVEAIRSEAEAISGTSLGRRVPEPGTSDEIGRLAETMNRMLDRLEASARSQRQFVSDASHELKSPIATIRTILDVVRREQSPDSYAFVEDVAAENDRLEHLVQNLLLLARFDEGVLQTRPADVDLDDIVLSESAVIARVATVRVDVSEVRPVRLRGDVDGLRSLVRNLVENAVRYAASTVWVVLDGRDDHAILTVSDDGPGIAPEDRERVFDRFVRLDESRDRARGGTGLGLAVARAIARSTGGEVKIVEPAHGGATFEAVVRSVPPPTDAGGPRCPNGAAKGAGRNA